jgi:hypothetical protein
MSQARPWFAPALAATLAAIALAACHRDTGGGPACGAATCAAGQRCCDHCSGACVPEGSGAFCPDDNDPGRACGGGDSATGVDSGAAGGDAAGGTDATPGTDATATCGATDQCAVGTSPCCEGLCCPVGTSCCMGVPVPPGAEYCAVGCPDG